MEDSLQPLIAHVSSEDGWEHDDETGGLVRMLPAGDEVQFGLWKPGHVPVNTWIEFELEANETLVVLDGEGQVIVDDGAPIKLQRGVVVSIPRGSRTRWMVFDDEFREIWLYY